MRYKRMPKEIFMVRNWITLTSSYLELFRSSRPHPSIFENFSRKLWVKLQTDCSEYWLYTKMTPPRMFFWKSFTWTVQKQSSTTIHFGNFPQTIPVVESFFWSNYRLAVQSSDYILKGLHQERFLGNLPKYFGDTKYYRL